MISGTFDAVASTANGMMKFPTKNGVATITPTYEALVVSSAEEAEESQRDNIKKLSINPAFPKQVILINRDLSQETMTKLRNLLIKNKDVFAWSPFDMGGVPSHEAEHALNISETTKPVTQKRLSLAPDRSMAACKEVDKLVEARILRKVKYHTWVANPVMVRKFDGSWRMCMDFKDLNKACPKDFYTLPEIDWKVNSLTGFKYKCFLDAYKGYHQIQTHIKDTLRFKKRRSHLPEVNRQCLLRTYRQEYGRLCRRPGGQKLF